MNQSNDAKPPDWFGVDNAPEEPDGEIEEEPSRPSTWSIVGREARSILLQAWDALKITLVLALVCGVVFPAIVYGLGQLAFNKQANGSLIKDTEGNVVGSELLGQQFTQPQYFHGRPSVVGYNGAGSSGSNIGPTNPQLITGNGSEVDVEAGATPPANGTPVASKANTYFVPGSYAGVSNYAQQFRTDNSVSTGASLPADIVTASGSGLDPHISIEAANLQINRVVAARQSSGEARADLTPQRVGELIQRNTEGRDLLVLGEPRVSVLKLNRDLDATFGSTEAP